MSRALYIFPNLSGCGIIESHELDQIEDVGTLELTRPACDDLGVIGEDGPADTRRKIKLNALGHLLKLLTATLNGKRASSRYLLISNLLTAMDEHKAEIAIIELEYGWLNFLAYASTSMLITNGYTVFVYWPGSHVVQRLSKLSIKFHTRMMLLVRLARFCGLFSNSSSSFQADQILSSFSQAAKPNSFKGLYQAKNGSTKLDGSGLYLRQDFWNTNIVGGSYAHTIYVAKELAKSSKGLTCLTTAKFKDFGRFGLTSRSLVWPISNTTYDTLSYLQAGAYFYNAVRLAAIDEQPDFLYERLCLGNANASRVSRELNIPYIVEYNGSELSILRSFGFPPPENSELLLAAENAAFEQASIISVVSEPIAQDLIDRGVAADKILINPNGVDTDDIRPPTQTERYHARNDLNYAEDDCVVCFLGTFGGWHGIGVLAQAIPQIVKANAKVKFLLIGDGDYRHLIDEQVTNHNLHDAVRITGLVPPEKARTMLRSCDICIAPHDRDMVDMPFFGSPIKVFEYMATGTAIVASDLRQIGEVLQPAITYSKETLPKNGGQARAMLVQPGNVNELAGAVTWLAQNTALRQTLGQNARDAAVNDFSWQAHVSRLWDFARTRENTHLVDAPVHSSTGATSKLSKYIPFKSLEGLSIFEFDNALSEEKLEMLPTDNFDLICSTSALTHTQNSNRLLQELHRSLKPSGCLVLALQPHDSLHFWWFVIWRLSVRHGFLQINPVWQINTRYNNSIVGTSSALAKTYSTKHIRVLCSSFAQVQMFRRSTAKKDSRNKPKWIPKNLWSRLQPWEWVMVAHKRARR